MNQIMLADINQNYYSDKHLNLKNINNDNTYIIDKDKIDYIEVIPFPVLNKEHKEELHYQFLIFVGDTVFSFETTLNDYYEPLLLGAKEY